MLYEGLELLSDIERTLLVRLLLIRLFDAQDTVAHDLLRKLEGVDTKVWVSYRQKLEGND